MYIFNQFYDSIESKSRSFASQFLRNYDYVGLNLQTLIQFTKITQVTKVPICSDFVINQVLSQDMSKTHVLCFLPSLKSLQTGTGDGLKDLLFKFQDSPLNQTFLLVVDSRVSRSRVVSSTKRGLANILKVRNKVTKRDSSRMPVQLKDLILTRKSATRDKRVGSL